MCEVAKFSKTDLDFHLDFCCGCSVLSGKAKNALLKAISAISSQININHKSAETAMPVKDLQSKGLLVSVYPYLRPSPAIMAARAVPIGTLESPSHTYPKHHQYELPKTDRQQLHNHGKGYAGDSWRSGRFP